MCLREEKKGKKGREGKGKKQRNRKERMEKDKCTLFSVQMIRCADTTRRKHRMQIKMSTHALSVKSISIRDRV